MPAQLAIDSLKFNDEEPKRLTLFYAEVGASLKETTVRVQVLRRKS